MTPKLQLISSKQVAQAGETDLVAYCDPYDLVAIVTVQSDVVVYRINGQIVFTIKNTHADLDDDLVASAISAVSWKQDGSRLAVGWTDGSYGIYSGEDGKLVISDSVCNPAETSEEASASESEGDEYVQGTAVTRFGWAKYQRGPLLPNDQIRDQANTDEWHDGGPDLHDPDKSGGSLIRNQGGSIAKLTRAIKTLDVTGVLPKLSAIPSHGLRAGVEDSKFSTQAATDAILEPQKEASADDVDVLIICCSDGLVHVMLDDAVKIGTCQVGWRPLMHAFHPSRSTQAVMSHLVNQQSFHMAFLDLPLETLGGPLLNVVATNTKRVQNLLAYITNTIRCIEHDYTTGTQIPNRFIASANATLADTSQDDLQVNLIHLAMTGAFSSAMLEWLTEILREVNHKRWDQAVNTMCTNLQNHVFVNLIPAIDRLSIATTSLRGQARVAEGSTDFNVQPDLFSSILDSLDSLRLVAHRVQLLVIDEQRQFRAFSKWLRVMIEIGVAGPGSKSAAETEEREVPNLDYELLLKYINSSVMTKPALANHVERLKDTQLISEGHPGLLERTTVVLDLSNSEDRTGVTNLPALAAYLEANVNAALSATTEWQSRMLTAPTSFDIQSNPQVMVTDIAMHKTGAVAALGCSRHEPQAHKLHVVAVTDQLQYPAVFQGVPLSATERVHILDAKFLDGGQHALLLTRSDESAFEIRKTDTAALIQSSHEGTAFTADTLHVSLQERGFDAAKLLIGGREGKRVCVVINQDGNAWHVFDLDSKEEMLDESMVE